MYSGHFSDATDGDLSRFARESPYSILVRSPRLGENIGGGGKSPLHNPQHTHSSRGILAYLLPAPFETNCTRVLLLSEPTESQQSTCAV